MNWLPNGWAVGPARRWIHVRVPEEAQGGALELSRVEAFAVAAALVRAVGRSWLPQAAAGAGQVGAGESAELGPLLDELFGVSADEFLVVLRRLPPLRPWSTATTGNHEAQPLEGVDEVDHQKSTRRSDESVPGDHVSWTHRLENASVACGPLKDSRDALVKCRNLVAGYLACLTPVVVSDEGRSSADGHDDDQ